MHRFWYRGHSCREFGIYASGDNAFNAPEWDHTAQSVPGRNGDLLFSEGRYKNITVAYPCFIRNKFAARAQAARQWLLMDPSYHRLEDDYSPATFRLGFFAGPIDFDMRFLNRGGETEIAFECKPQRFYKSGELPVTLAQSGAALHNPGFAALPLVTVYGSGPGSLTVGGVTVQIKALEGSLTLDCELQDAYKGTENKNKDILAPVFPTLPPGESAVYWTGGVQRVEITPRWWTL